MGKLAKFIFYLDNKQMLTPPSNWRGLETLATFVRSNNFDVRTSETVQGNITIDNFTFTNENAQTLIEYREGGVNGTSNGVFEGLSFKIDVSDDTTTSNLFDGYIDFKNNYREISPAEVSAGVKQLDSLNSFDDRIRVNQFEFLESIGIYKQSDYVDIPFLVEPLDAEAQLVALEIAFAMFAIQAAQLVKEIGKDIAIVVALAANIVTIPASLLIAIAVLVLDIIFLGVLIVRMVKLLISIVELLAPPVRNHKGIFFDVLLEKAFDYLGYKFETGIEELSNVAYLGHKGSGEGLISKGIPKIGEALSSVSSAVEVVLKTFNARIAIIDNTVHIRTESDPFWIRNSPYTLPIVGNSDASAMNLESEEVVLNTNDFNATTFLGFLSDSSDQWTLADDEGTDVQVIREPITLSDRKKLLFNGLEDVRIQLALGSRKSKLSQLEQVLELVRIQLNPIIQTSNKILSNQIKAKLKKLPAGVNIPAPTNTFLLSLISNRIGALRLSSKSFSVAKMVYLENTDEGYRIPANYREKFSAGVMYDKYHISNSFSEDNNFGKQRRLFFERTIPFTYSDFLKVNNNSYFSTSNGKKAKIESVKWKIDADTAVVDYWVEQVYTENIKETKIETQ